MWESASNTENRFLVIMSLPTKRIIPPGAFLPAAERYNLVDQLDAWVIRKAFTLLAENPAFLDQITFISINLSGQSLTKHDFLDFIILELNKSGIEGHKICFEITETAAISNLNEIRRKKTLINFSFCRTNTLCCGCIIFLFIRSF